MSGGMVVTAPALATTAATAIEFITTEQEKWVGKGPNDLLDAIHEALTSAVNAANTMQVHEANYQTIRAAAYALMLATASCATACRPHAPGVH
ncbi:hypothetical protein [Komagataeibacter xylinus]|uniref:hypothetical protein n=1 Tax=Komagataeibacter xylinus TaxID=28448 RepID=UPI00280BCD0A|nr:hypothetical protein [Komagataeibacter xylinus]